MAPKDGRKRCCIILLVLVIILTAVALLVYFFGPWEDITDKESYQDSLITMKREMMK